MENRGVGIRGQYFTICHTMNLELRSNVLEKNLIIEDLLSSLLAILFRFQKDSSRTLGSSGNALSLKTKADLLNDIGRLTESEYKELILFMEVRNQLIHNRDCDTLLKAVERSNKLNKLLSRNKKVQEEFVKHDDLDVKESGLKVAFQELYGSIVDSCYKTLDKISMEIQEEEKRIIEAIRLQSLEKITKYLGTAIVKVSESFDDIFMEAFPGKPILKDVMKNSVWSVFWKNFKEENPDIYEELKKNKLSSEA